MIYYLKLLSIVIAVSLDSFGVGMTYGMRKIKVHFFPLLIIMSCSGMMVFIAMTIGNIISAYISSNITSSIGGIILIFLGLFMLVSIFSDSKKSFSNHIFVHQSVLSSPQKIDKDRSGTIQFNEAIILGSALAMDAFGAGIGVSMMGYKPILTAILIAGMSGGFLFIGMRTGFLLSKIKVLSKLTFLPPIILISIGIYHFFSG